jgi:hypothetical protein
MIQQCAANAEVAFSLGVLTGSVVIGLVATWARYLRERDNGYDT